MLLAGVAAISAHAADEPLPMTAIQLSFDRPIDAVVAPFFVAVSHGLFRAERVSVSTNVAPGSPDAIARVAAGASDMALVDFNALIRYRDKADAVPVKAVFVLLNAAPYAIVARKSRGIHDLQDLAGKTLGVAEGDLSIRLWPSLARRNGVRQPSVKLEKIGAAVREPMLSAGQVDAVTGFSYLSAVNLRDRGIPADDLAVLRYADYGCKAYGLALVVNPTFAAAKPQAVKGFLRAVTAGLQLVIKNPSQSADEVAAQIEGGSRDLERERLRTVLRDNVVTDEVRRNGIGGVDGVRFETSLDQIAEDFKFRQRPGIDDIFDRAFLSPADERKIN